MKFLDKHTLNQLYRFGIALTGSPQDAEDVLHTAIERFLVKNPQNVSEKSAFIRTIMRNYWYDEIRKQKNHQAHVESLQVEQNDTDIDKDRLEDIVIDQHDFQKHWQALQAPQRELLYMHCVLEYSAQEIADEFNCARGTILSRIHRLKKQLKQLSSSHLMGLSHE